MYNDILGEKLKKIPKADARVFPKISVEDTFSSQKMTAPTGIIFTIKRTPIKPIIRTLKKNFTINDGIIRRIK